MSIPTLLTVKLFTKKHHAFHEGGLRHQKFNEDKNGLKDIGAFVKVDGRVLINEQRYFTAIELKRTGEFDAVVRLIREAKQQGKYLSPEDAVAQIRGVAA